MIRKLFIIFFLISALPTFAAEKYASPSGSSTNSGNSISEAWSLSFALGATSPLIPGDSLLLADGIYPGNYISVLNGSADKPIRIMPVNTGKAIIDAGINRSGESGILVKGNYTWFIGMHITSSSTIRYSDASNGYATIEIESGITVTGDNNKLINCWIYDVVGGGMQFWRSGLNLEVYGCVIFNNGWQEIPRGSGHGMYIQHDDINSPKRIISNIVFQNASQGINIYTTNPINRGVIVDRNVSFNTGAIADFDPILFRPPHNLTIGSKNNLSSDVEVLGNIFYSDLQGGRLTSNQVSNVTFGRTYFPNLNLKFTGNRVYGGRNQVELLPASNLEFTRNLLFNTNGKFIELLGTDKTYPDPTWDLNSYINFSSNTNSFDGFNFSDWKTTYGFDSDSREFSAAEKPVETLVVQNKYDPNLYYVTILNLSNQETISVDFSEYGITEGRDYVIRDFQNPFDEGQRIVSKTSGNMISFPMNWTKSLQPKGNMPHQVVHTDKTFGTFILKMEQLAESYFPVLKDSVSLFLDEEGKAVLTPEDFLKVEPVDPFTYTSSVGFDFTCSNIGENDVIITSKNTQTGEEWTESTKVWVFDTIPPYFDAANATYLFDRVVGKVSISIADFDIVDFKDNCAQYWNISQSRFEVTCADIYQNWEFPVVLTSTDPSGNSYSRTVKAIIGNIIESKKVSITSLDPLTDDGSSTLRLGNELEYEVLGWTRNGQLIPGETGKEISVNSPGQYQAGILLSSGCSVGSKSFNFEDPDFPEEYTNDVNLILDESGKATLTIEDVFGTNQGIAEEVILGQTDFDCTDLGTQKVKVTLNKGSLGVESFTDEFWINVIVKDTTAPVFEEKFTPVNFDFDLVVGELILDPLDFFTTLPVDNCGLDGILIQLSQLKITCKDIDSEQITYPVFFEISVSDGSGNSRTFPAAANLRIVESKKVSLTAKGKLYPESTVELLLGDELQYEVLEWRKNQYLIPDQTSKTLTVSEPGLYSAGLILANGCMVYSEAIEIKEFEIPYSPVKDIVEIALDQTGVYSLKPEDVFVSWPLADPNLDIKLSQSEFTCSDIGEKQIIIIISDQTGTTWEEITQVKVQDNLSPALTPKNFNVDFDVTVGSLTLNPADFISELIDNCGIKDVTINKTTVTCEDLGKVIPIEIRAVDLSGNITEKIAQLTVKGINSAPVTITGPTEFCAGSNSELTLNSSAPFEVVRWRKDGVEIPEQNGKVLSIEEGGNYDAVIRYEGACLAESNKVEVKKNELPTGEIVKDGKLLSAPTYSAYQWYRNGEKIANAISKTHLVTEPGEYTVEVTNAFGCFSRLKSVTFSASDFEVTDFPPVNSNVIIQLNQDGVAILKPVDLFETYPLADTSITVAISKTEFSCENLGENSVKVILTDSKGQTSINDVVVLVKDTLAPAFNPKSIELELDLSIGRLELNPAAFYTDLKDNCGIKEIGINRTAITCEDLGKVIPVEIRAVDLSGNITEKIAQLTVKGINSAPVTITGPTEFCAGSNSELTLNSSAPFEVVRWRKDGVEIPSQNGKVLSIEEGGNYDAVIRYEGACLTETVNYEVKLNSLPSGEITPDGYKLVAPEGNFTYQWFRNGDKLEGATQRTLTVNQMGEYAVELTNEAGCVARLASVTMTISGIFNPGILITEELKIYPNPASSEVKIQALGDLEFAENSMRIYSMNGKEVSSSIEVVYQSPSEVTLAISRLAAGTYVIMVESPDNKVFVGRLVKR